MIEYGLFKEAQAGEVSRLVRRTYDEFVAPDYPREGNEHFYTFITAEALIDRFSKAGHFIITAAEDGTVVGVIAVRDHNHIALMFVDTDHQGRGIARRLLEKAKRKITAETDKREATVFSSPYAVPVYTGLGFRKIGKMEQKDGIIFQPMKYRFEAE